MAGAVIIEETARLQARAISGGQFRHTSLETVRPDFHACMLIGTDGTRNLMIDMASELAGYGGNIVLVGHDLPKQSAHVAIELQNSSPQFTPLVQIVPLQLLAYSLAQSRGLEPGRFDRLSKVIETE
jgi:glucosamine--fructose-6-phosphate aminotransferase (isomerizing)